MKFGVGVAAILLSVVGHAAAHNLYKYPPSHHFEESVQIASKKTSDASPIDLRITRALGSKGYDYVRISVINHTPEPPNADFTFEYSSPFVGRWVAAFDLGASSTTCSSDPISSTSDVCDGDCILICSNSTECQYYNFNEDTKRCSLYDSCDFTPVNNTNSVTYTKFGQNFLHSAVVKVNPGEKSTLKIDRTDVEVFLPKENTATSGIVWSDPCISGRWVGCQQSDLALDRSVSMMNALSKDESWHYFQILGDNFYDQDGRLTKSIWDGFNLEAKSKLLMTVPGNHDLWVAGGPDKSDNYDQFGWGFMQWYGQDSVASTISENGFLDFSVDVNANTSSVDFYERNSGLNFLWYNKVGGVGFMGFNGAALPDSESSYFKEACAYFSGSSTQTIYVLGHWSKSTNYTDSDPILGVPELRERLATVDGCDIGDKLKYMDGHTHSNYMQEGGEKESVGFMIGGHGMSGAGQYGFAYVKNSGDGEDEVWYFEEFNTQGDDNYEAILECVKTKGVGSCTEYATR